MNLISSSITPFARRLGPRDPYADSERYVRPHDLGTLLIDSLRLYVENWRVVAGIYLVPALALAVLNHWAGDFEASGFWPMIYVLLSILLLGPLTVAVSEACLGDSPRVIRTFNRLAGKPLLALTGAILLQLLLMFSGFFVMLGLDNYSNLLIVELGKLEILVLIATSLIPIILFGVWYMFIQPAIVLEHCDVLKSFRRSRFLGRGYVLRNLIYSLTIGNLLVVVGWSGSLLLRQVHRPTPDAGWLMEAAEVVLGTLPGLVLTPIISIALVLLYYDLRVRKEGFGLEQLEQELHD